MKLRNSGEFSVKQICEIMNITKSVYYRAINAKKEENN